ncbi:hypothetical protein [Allomuricauda sp. NBRC 101325]|uniref:hypothetical protein n=1 Tax=Allomuricauda sp. NBRC 101325 TaxID=1113758 RepID=UPI0024A14B0D|nr:hypothetical protein [Muricauda sp. NBRC 101325]GLU44733.1 hypothetical protein Musp01_23570 [Muricauda sp. NBRC 101325]
MPIPQQVNFNEISLDLSNLRMMPQKTEEEAIQVMIAIKPDRFFAVIESILDDGYLETENIILFKTTKSLTVKEGNRRIAALKLIHGVISTAGFSLPDDIKNRIKKVTGVWKKENTMIPCLVFEENEIDKVNKIVSLTHGKGEKASRDPWSSVARARHNRDEKGQSELGLDLLEKYLKNGGNLTGQQKERWSGDFPITVLDASLKILAHKCGFENSLELIENYPKINDREKLEDVLINIGLGNIGFSVIRDQNKDFTLDYGFKAEPTKEEESNDKDKNTDSTNSGSSNSNSNSNQDSNSSNSSNNQKNNKPKSPTKSPAINTQRHVRNLLKKFTPKGDRPKVTTLKNELSKLSIKDNPIAFCFVLRSIFEISAKAYCADNKISIQDKNGNEKKLASVLTIVTNHLTNDKKNTGMVKVLHGALNEITAPNRILSVTSMNQLVHNPHFSVQQGDVCTLFSNIYPLLEAMN